MLPERMYSGLETEGMKEMNCTLKLQSHWTFGANIHTLDPSRVLIPFDGSANKSVQFPGCKIIQLSAGGFREEEKRGSAMLMPPSFTVAGPCTYTKEDKKDFEIMMRSQELSRIMHLPPNGEYDWPDYRALETCPGCCIRAKPGSDKRYWLLIQPLLQRLTDVQGIGVRMLCRMACEDCFESMTDEKTIQVRVAGATAGEIDVPLIDVIEEQGPITWLSDGRMSARCAIDGTIMNAYNLYGAWEHSGAWQRLSDDFSNQFQRKMESSGLPVEGRTATRNKDPSTFWEMEQIPTKEGRKCDGPNCPNVHGIRKAPEPGKKKGKKIRLNECTGCFETMYCSEQCQHAAWPDHKDECKEVQRKRKEEDNKKKAQQQMDEEARMEEALASFVPLGITPQGGGGKKKKGKKGGGKKKKGKK